MIQKSKIISSNIYIDGELCAKLLHPNMSCLKLVIVKRPCAKLANQMNLATGTDILKS